MGEGMRTIVLLAALLAGCASGPQVVNVPVSMPCLGPSPASPDYRYGVGEYPGNVQAAKLMAVDLVAAKQYSVDLKAQMAGCK
jgi:hypothetical protein